MAAAAQTGKWTAGRSRQAEVRSCASPRPPPGEHVEQFRHRPLGEAGPITFVAADALAMTVREGMGVVNAGTLLATGVNAGNPGSSGCG